MKVLVALLLCSLAANAALFVRSRTRATASPSSRSTAVEAGMSSDERRAAEAKEAIATLFDSTKTDGATLKARLEAAGFPPEVVRAAVMAQLQHDNRQRHLALLGDQPLQPFWKTGTTPFGLLGGDPEKEKDLNRLRQEFRTNMRNTFGSDEHMSGELLASYQQRWGPLSKEKIELVQRISNDYAELQRELMAGRMPNTLTAEERDKIALLQREQRTDLEAALTPEELFEYDLRASPTASRLRLVLQAFDPSEEEYRAIFKVQRAYDQTTGRDANTAGMVYISTNQGNEERAALLQGLKGTLSEERLADFEFATNPTSGMLVRLTNRLGLPIQTARDVTDTRTQTMQAIARIRSDRSLTPEERTSQIAEVARATTETITGALGAEGYQAYFDYGGSWLNSLTASNARSTPRTP